MQRLLLFLFVSVLSLSLTAQVTEIIPNKGLQLEMPLSSNKALLVESFGNRLWVTDATTAGTFKLSDTLTYEDAGGLLNGKFIFAATSPNLGSELWITDGTVDGTKLLKDILPGKPGAEPHDDFTLMNGYLYFSAKSNGFGRELWRTNGTPEGTTMVKDIVTGLADSGLKGRFDITSAGSYILFSCTPSASVGYELWRSDGTDAGTYLLKDINPGSPSSQPSAYQSYNNITLFWAETANEGRELWRTDGTADGTTLVKDIRPGTSSSVTSTFPLPTISFLYPFNNRLLFTANDGLHGDEIWTTDGTTDGTYLLQDINQGPDQSFVSLINGVPLNGKLFFAAYKPTIGSELWETDGTIGGTKLFKEIMPGLDGGIPFLMPNFKFTSTTSWPVHQGPEFYFMFGLPADGGVELWKSNGTDAGTTKVKTIKTVDSDFGNLSYVYTNAGLYFSVDDGVKGDELWKSTGTGSGTNPVIDLNPGVKGSNISFYPFPINNKYVFEATNGDDAFLWDLYRLDGDLIPLPVKLDNFSVTLAGADALLQWHTRNEENMQGFVIERSDDGKRFTSIGTVAATGSQGNQQHYSFKDVAIAGNGRPVVYYRLQIKDRDGKWTHSKIVSLGLKRGSNFTVQLLGNPVQNEVRVLFSKTDIPVNLTIRDASGRVVKGLQVKNETGTVSIPATELSPGAYFLQAECNGKVVALKFLKQ